MPRKLDEYINVRIIFFLSRILSLTHLKKHTYVIVVKHVQDNTGAKGNLVSRSLEFVRWYVPFKRLLVVKCIHVKDIDMDSLNIMLKVMQTLGVKLACTAHKFSIKKNGIESGAFLALEVDNALESIL